MSDNDIRTLSIELCIWVNNRKVHWVKLSFSNVDKVLLSRNKPEAFQILKYDWPTHSQTLFVYLFCEIRQTTKNLNWTNIYFSSENLQFRFAGLRWRNGEECLSFFAEFSIFPRISQTRVSRLSAGRKIAKMEQQKVLHWKPLLGCLDKSRG